jgi:SAM-dependent methyltransferase
MSMKYLDNRQLERSPVVANSTMNRGRGLLGVNSYARDLSFDPLDFLIRRLDSRDSVRWLDLCCGSGKALIEAALHIRQKFLVERVRLLGIDLIPMFEEFPSDLGCLELKACSVFDYESDVHFDLVTCVHGLHYVGDKLGLLQRIPSWLKDDGLFLGHLDFDNLKLSGDSASSVFLRGLRRQEWNYDSRRHLLRLDRSKLFVMEYRYVGADDGAGSNYTGQPSVTSYYQRIPVDGLLTR